MIFNIAKENKIVEFGTCVFYEKEGTERSQI